MRLVYDENAIARLKQEYPRAIIGPSGYTLMVPRTPDGVPLCMKCGNVMVNRSNYKIVRGEWVVRRTRGFSRWVCPPCDPFKGQPLIIGISPSIQY
jgi:hypothetical protein